MNRAIKEHLQFLYGSERAQQILLHLSDIVEDYRRKICQLNLPPRSPCLDEKTIFLITYPDQLFELNKPTLLTLEKFANIFLKDLINTIHILPFYPYSSDDGFSVVDYYSAEPRFGDWEHIHRLSSNFNLMFDFVLNHISAQSHWFKAFLRGNPEYRDYFIVIDTDVDLSRVFRPRTSPILTEFNSAFGKIKVWTTFSSDQIDLNYSNPDLLLQALNVLLYYAANGASYIRLDAVAYLWKQIGTACIHLPQTHRVIQLLKAVSTQLFPYLKFITETNVPYKDNISYFGDGSNEADLVYNFTLPPLVLFTFLTGNSRKLTDWANMLSALPRQMCFLNYLASHDGIGVVGVKDILTEEELNFLVTSVLQREGFVSYRNNHNGSASPYELNINYFDAIADVNGTEETTIKRFIAAHAIMLALKGVPAFYFHSLFGSRGDRTLALETGIPRRINRQKYCYDDFINQMNSDSRRRVIFEQLKKLILIRKQSTAFSPFSSQQVIDAGETNFAILRINHQTSECVLAIHNISGKSENIDITLPDEFKSSTLKCLINPEKSFNINEKGRLKFKIEPYEIIWLKKIRNSE